MSAYSTQTREWYRLSHWTLGKKTNKHIFQNVKLLLQTSNAIPVSMTSASGLMHSLFLSSLLPSGAAADSYSDSAGHRVTPLPIDLLVLGDGCFQCSLRPGVWRHGCNPYHCAGWDCGRQQARKRTWVLHAHTQQRRPAWAAHSWWVRKIIWLSTASTQYTYKKWIWALNYYCNVPSDPYHHVNWLTARKLIGC